MRRRLHGTRTTFVRVFEVHVGCACRRSVAPAAAAGEFRVVGRPATWIARSQPCKAGRGAGRGSRRVIAGFSPGGFSPALSVRALAPDLARFTRPAAAARRRPRDRRRAPIDLLPDPPRLPIAPRDARAARPAADGSRAAGRSCASRALGARHPGGGRRRARVRAAAAARSVAEPSTGYDDVKQIAVARLLADNIESIQVDWPLYGPKLAQVALTMGADDVDGVAAVRPGELGSRRSPSKRSGATSAPRRLEAVERDGRFRFAGLMARRFVSARCDYLNARPLVYGLELRPDLFDVRFDLPSECAALLHEGADRRRDDPVDRVPARCRSPTCIVPGLGIISRRAGRVGRALHARAARRDPDDRGRHQLADVGGPAAGALCRERSASSRSSCRCRPDAEAMLARATPR